MGSFVEKNRVNKGFDLKTKQQQRLCDPCIIDDPCCLELNFVAPWQCDVTVKDSIVAIMRKKNELKDTGFGISEDLAPKIHLKKVENLAIIDKC